MQDETRNIPLDQIIEPWVILRVVNKHSVEYLEMRDSIAERGFWNSICVRPSPRRPGLYEVVDGLYRHTAACELRMPAMPCIVKCNLTDEDVLVAQIQANAVRPETTVMEYARQIKKIMAARPGMTLAELSNLIHKNPDWIGQMLDLLDLRIDIQKAVDRGEIPLGSAYLLARVPRNRQGQFLELAKTAPVKEFAPIVAGFLKRFQEAVRQGKMDDLYKEFEPVAHLRNLKEVLAEYREHRVAGLLMAKAKCETPLAAWYLALQWVLHLDAQSVEEQREKVLQRTRANILEREVEPCSENERSGDENE